MVLKRENIQLNFYDEKLDILIKEHIYKIIRFEILIYTLIN